METVIQINGASACKQSLFKTLTSRDLSVVTLSSLWLQTVNQR